MTELMPIAARLRSADRIHIIGGPGSGKSTLARRLGGALGLPVYALDTLAYEGPEFAPRPPSSSERNAIEIAELPQWISEGIFLGWTDPLLRQADVIIWLDHATWRSAAGRIVSRSLRYAFGEMKTRRGAERFLRFTDYARNIRQVVFVLIRSREYWHPPQHRHRYPVTRQQVEKVLDAHAVKVVHITRKDEEAALRRLASNLHVKRAPDERRKRSR
jgi:adenylate kinase family enzyme